MSQEKTVAALLEMNTWLRNRVDELEALLNSRKSTDRVRRFREKKDRVGNVSETFHNVPLEIKRPVKEPKKDRSKEFEGVWLAYERKGAKSVAFDAYCRYVPVEAVEQFQIALKRYLDNEPRWKFRKDLERFIRPGAHGRVPYWRDSEWIDKTPADAPEERGLVL